MQTETLSKLALELVQFVNVKTPRELALEDLLRSARCIAQRHGTDTAWERFDESIAKLGVGSVTARVYKVLPSDLENTND